MQVKILLYFRYMRMNVAASDQHKQYDASVPKFLHNRPKTVVQHCMWRWFDAENSTLEDVDQVSSSQFLVKSLSDFKTALCYVECHLVNVWIGLIITCPANILWQCSIISQILGI